jgi:GNAT superfamily N-acetyltransferase
VSEKIDFQVVRVHPNLLLFVDQLQRKNAESLSFYPKCVFERESEKGRIFLGLLNGQPCGYLYVGAGGTDVKCHQVCIEYDARRKLYGASLVVAMEEYAQERGAYTLTLRCGFDLDANIFWKELGYKCIGVEEGGIRRMRKINIWRKQIRPDLFEIVEIEPSVGKTNASAWRKNKRTGIVTQFIRGKRLKEYRAIVLSDEKGVKKDNKIIMLGENWADVPIGLED